MKKLVLLIPIMMLGLAFAGLGGGSSAGAVPAILPIDIIESDIIPIKLPPAAPSNLTATPVAITEIELNWTDNSSNETGFIIGVKVTGSLFYSTLTTVGPNVTTYTHENPFPGLIYNYRVKAVNASGDSEYSNVATAATTLPAVPDAPSNLVATAVSSTTVDLSWTDNYGDETGFIIEARTGSSGYSVIGAIGPNFSTYTHTGLTPNTTYYYRVKARNDAGDSDYTNEVSATTSAVTPVPPAAPSDLVATTASSTAVGLSWTDNSTDETGFYLERREAGKVYELCAGIAPNGTNYTDQLGLVPNTTYYYRVRANNAAGYSDYANEVSITTPAPAPPAAPSNLVATSASSTAVNLSWTDNSGDETGFMIEARTGSTAYSVIGAIGPNFSTFAHTGLAPDTTYYYRVKAYDVFGVYSSSNETSVTTPGATPVSPAPPASEQMDYAIILHIGNPYMNVNGASREIDPGRTTVPVILNNRTLVPIRAVVEAMGGTAEWDATEAKVTVQLKDTKIELWIDSNTTRVNDEEKLTDAAPQLILQRTMLPLRFVTENLGYEVDWDGTGQKITIKPKP